MRNSTLQPNCSIGNSITSNKFNGHVVLPFIKWAGGKRGIISQIKPLIPKQIKNYYEPFLGGGAVFFSIAERVKHAILSDTNVELITTFKVVRSRVNELIEALEEHQQFHNVDGYYEKIRAFKPFDEIEIAARFIYLNKTCFNGLYRVNRAGQFNVPKGSYKNPDICNVNKLIRASRALKKATLRIGDFEQCVNPQTSDLIYCDPPYDDCFSQYQANGFTQEDQVRLQKSTLRWIRSGAKVMISNSNTKLMRNLYMNSKSFEVTEIMAPRTINCNANGRSPVSEILATSKNWRV